MEGHEGPVGAPAPIDWFALVTGLSGGVALLNYSLARLSSGLRSAFGTGLRDAIKYATRTRALAFATGVVVTALLSSATASSLLVLSFVQCGDATLQQSLGMGLGIFLGSTLNAHLLSFNLNRYSMSLVAVGYSCSAWAEKHWVGHLGEATFGLGLLFASTAVVTSALAPLRGYPPFLALLLRMHNPALAIAGSALAAVVFQSSNTVIAIAIMLAQQGLLTSAVGVYIVLGSNVGTSVTPVLAAVGRRREALRVAVAYLAMKGLGVATLLPLLPRFVGLVRWSTLRLEAAAEGAAYDALVDRGGIRNDARVRVAERLEALGQAAVLPAQVANAHTLANAWVALVCMPLLSHFAAWAAWALPDEGGSDGRQQLKRTGSESDSEAWGAVHRKGHGAPTSGTGGGGGGGGGAAPAAGACGGGYGATAHHVAGAGASVDGPGGTAGSPGDRSHRSGDGQEDHEHSPGGVGGDPAARRLYARRR